MKNFISLLFYSSFVFLPLGMLYKIQHWPGGNEMFILGLLAILIYFTVKTLKDYLQNRNDRLNILLQILIASMSVILFSKYLFHFFGDYPGLLIIPFFIVISVIYLVKGKTKYNKLTTATIAYLLLSIPLFVFDFHKAPRKYIPYDWYNRYDIGARVAITLPYGFQFKETAELDSKACKLRDSHDFDSAILIYLHALKLEPQNPRLLFNISECYAKINDLETAIAFLDTAILIDSTYEGFYNNRGLLFYKLKENDKAIRDFEKGIQLDSTHSTLYANLALAYYHNDLFEKACESIEKATKYGLKIDDMDELKRIKKERCNNYDPSASAASPNSGTGKTGFFTNKL